jgi:sorbitol/mannitol transport system permease protein
MTAAATAPSVVAGARPPSALQRPWVRRLPLLPALVFTVLITQIPFVMSIWYSLTDWKVVPPTPRQFVGLENYT